MQAAFPEFAVVREFGTYAWEPGADANEHLKAFDEVTDQDILSRLPAEPDAAEPDVAAQLARLSLSGPARGGPPRLDYAGLRLPRHFQSLPPQQFPNQFPNDPSYLVPVLVAMQRGLSLDDVDFVLGGSSLEVLANRRVECRTDILDDTKFVVQRLGHALIVARSGYYGSNYADVAFQFKRLVTGRRAEDQHGNTKCENVRLVRLGDFTVLFAADADAVDE
eukprot:EG_transcript_29300